MHHPCLNPLTKMFHIQKGIFSCLLYKTVNKRFYQTNKVRVRFAPSPTGYLHLGGLRTALYNYLFAKSHNGKFILRIEDTDQTRLVPGATEQLQNDLQWAGIEINEGPFVGGNYGPYIQSQRINIYKEYVQKLIENGFAYYCFCTDKRLDLLRREALRIRQVPKYDNRCRNLSREELDKRLGRKEKCCIRFKLTPDCETFEDLIFGNIAYDVAVNEGDPVIMKSDGFPTYHFANVVDDHLMEITYVLRGVEWQISTTKHILMYRAFNWEPPVYGHLPLLLNPDGTKLSKRQGDIKISYYKESGIFPLAVINFITNSGGGFEKDSQVGVKPEIYTIDELAKQFNITRINSHSGRLMPERLLEFNRLELERRLQNKKDEEVLIEEVKELVKAKFSEKNEDNFLQLDDNYIKFILHWSVSRINKLSDLLSNKLAFVWVMPQKYEILDKSHIQAVENLSKTFNNTDNLDKDKINQLLKHFAEENDVKYNGFMKTLRLILSGLKEGPSVAEMIEILGKKNTLQRLQLFIKNNR